MTGYRPRLRTVLLIVNLAVVALPLAGIFFFRIYENQLVQQTESELISQAAVIAATYRQKLAERLPNPGNYGIPLAELPLRVDEYYTPIMPQIDFARTELLPPRPDGVVPVQPADPAAAETGDGMSAILLDTQKVTLSGLKLDRRDQSIASGITDSRVS